MKYPRSTYYEKQLQKPENNRQIETKNLQEAIMKIYNDSGKVYGAPKIRECLKKQGYKNISVKRVQRHMKKLRIRSIVIKKYKPHSTKTVYAGGENLLKRDFSTKIINEKWVADITYIHTLKNGWCHLASILSIFSIVQNL
ncbi:MAG: IS3 family transposase [Sedimentibacter sp.]